MFTASAAWLVALALALPAQATFPGRNGEIAYFDTYSLGYGLIDDGLLFGVCTDGTGKRQLLSGGLQYTMSAAFSPNGRWLAASGQPHPYSDIGSVAIFVGAVEGRRMRRITSPPRYVRDEGPVWSPKGGAIAFTRHDSARRPAVRIWSRGRARILTRDGYDPAWSARDEIAFTRGVYDPEVEEEQETIYVASANGGVARRLVMGSDPNWSPDGQRLVFNSRLKGKTYIAVISRDGSGLRRLARGRSASWSPDGRRIVFRTSARRPGRRGDGHAAVISPAGRGLRRLGLMGRNQPRPVFSPDSRWVAAAWNSDLYVVRVDGARRHYVASNRREYLSLLDWRPRRASTSLSTSFASIANGHDGRPGGEGCSGSRTNYSPRSGVLRGR